MNPFTRIVPDGGTSILSVYIFPLSLTLCPSHYNHRKIKGLVFLSFLRDLYLGDLSLCPFPLPEKVTLFSYSLPLNCKQ